ncbi:hypothetical protein ABT381_26370 [Streptomyces sp. NPDC000151]|uniref:hypothetical protein n=1 Tax=Streptomyces sp. NPDC000151 TaxID=3154244 RepID=UPI003317434D
MALTTGQKVAIAVGSIGAAGAIIAATITVVGGDSGNDYRCNNSATCGNNNKVSTSDDGDEKP